MEYTVKTLALERMTLRNMLGLSSSDIDRRLTLNYKYNIFRDLDVFNFHPIKYFGLGIGGYVDGKLRIPNKKNLTLYNLIPIRINDSTDRFRPNLLDSENDEERDKYRLRIELLDKNNNIKGYAYYLKVIDPSILTSKKVIESTDEEFTYTSDDDLNKYLRGIESTKKGEEFAKLPYYQTDNLSEENTLALSNIILNLINTDDDIISTIKYFNNEKYGLISEIGLFTGSDSRRSVRNIVYDEVYGCQLAIHSTSNPIDMIDKQNIFNIHIALTG